MKKVRAARLMAAALVGIVCLGPTAPLHAEEETTIEAFATWQGESTLVPMGSNPAVMVATLKGVVYIQTDKGPIRSATLICPAMVEVSLKDGALIGKGRCVWTTNDGSQAFADWTCQGRLMIGCKGDFTMTGGTQRFEGVTGGGPMVLRSELGTLAIDATGQAIERTASGIIFWPKLQYKIPSK